MKRIILYISFALCLGSCGASWRCHREIASERTYEIIDSVAYRAEEVSVAVPAESVSDAVPVGDTSRVQTSVAEATAWVEAGRVRQTLRNRSDQLLKITLDVPTYIHSEREYLTRTVIREVEKPPGKLGKALMYAGVTGIIAGLVALGRAIIRLRYKNKNQ